MSWLDLTQATEEEERRPPTIYVSEYEGSPEIDPLTAFGIGLLVGFIGTVAGGIALAALLLPRIAGITLAEAGTRFLLPE